MKKDLAVEVIAAAVARNANLVLLGNRVARDSEIEELLCRLAPALPTALMLVGPTAATKDLATLWLYRRKQLVVLRVDLIEDVAEIAARRVGLDSLVAALRDLAHGDGRVRAISVRRFRARRLFVPRRGVLPMSSIPINPTRWGRSKSPGRGYLRHPVVRSKA